MGLLGRPRIAQVRVGSSPPRGQPEHCEAHAVAHTEQTQLLSASYRLITVSETPARQLDSHVESTQLLMQLASVTQRAFAWQAATCELQVPPVP
jgi:hypothetical protein